MTLEAYSAIFQLASLYLITRLEHFPEPVFAFYVVNIVLNIFWSYIISYQIGIFNDVDPSGRFLAFYGTASHSGLAIGPYVGAVLLVDHRHMPLVYFGLATLAACYAFFLWAVYLGRRSLASEAPVPAA